MTQTIFTKTGRLRIDPVILAVSFLCVLGFFSVIIATRWGIGISPDSVVYIAGAKNLVAGRGYSIESTPDIFEGITHHAPLYSIMLSAFEMIGLDILYGARLLNALFFSANIFLVGFIIHRILQSEGKDSFWFPVLGSFLTLSSFVLIDIHSMAWTEPAFIFLSLLGLYWLGLYLDNSTNKYLTLAVLVVGFAALTRYAGLAVIATAVLGIIFISQRPWRDKLLTSLLFGLLTVSPLIAWLGMNWAASGTATNRELAFHPVTFGHLTSGLTTIASWFLVPDSASGYIKFLPVLFIFMLVVVFLVLRSPGIMIAVDSATVSLDRIPSSIKMFALFVPVYLSFLVGSITFLDANTPLDGRILSPIYIFTLMLVIYILAQIWSSVYHWQIARAGIMLSCFAMAVLFTFGGGIQIISTYDTGKGFNSAAWRQSEIIREVVNLPESQVIYSNVPEAIYIHTGRWAYGLPKTFDSVTQRPNDQFHLEMDLMASALKNQSGAIIYFNQVLRPNLPTDDELTHYLSLSNDTDRIDGVIYRWKEDD